MASRQPAVKASAHSSFGSGPSRERFNLLLLEDGEYYFRDHACYYWKDRRRVAGHLKVCSMSLYFVPRDIQEAVFRVPYKHTTGIEELEDEQMASGEDMFVVAATARVDMKAGDVHRPYHRHQGQFQFRFSLVYTSLGDVLPAVEELWSLAQQDATKEERAAAQKHLDEIIQEHESNECFNPGWLEDDNERVVLEETGSCITALCTQSGRVVLTQSRIYFQPFNVVSNAPIQTYQLDKVMFVMRRVYQLEDLGVEVFFPGRASLYLTFKTTPGREAFIKALMQQPNLQLEHMRSRDKWTRDWVNGSISNFDYLMYLNREAGRSFKDLTQYPVFPWVVADYASPSLDLNDPATFRDLTKPIGALNPERLKGFRERFTELRKLSLASPVRPGNEALSLDCPPPFLYGCHYSSPGYVVFYLMRSDPQLMLRLQNGRFDAPDRLFWSIQDTWKSVLTLPTDVKELIPEFYSNDASFLLNNDDIDFGTRSNGQRVGDVVLPPWATDAQDFVYKLAEALECPYVSSKLHKWINLVFGYKSRGPAAEAADNVFHYLTYDEIATKYLAQEKDPVMREALRLQMMEFGRTPRQLFTKRHPKRRASIATSGLLACLACTPQQMIRPAQPTNTLLGKGWAGRNITPVSRAVFKLTSKKASRRAATLAWLEQTAANHEPGVLALKQGKGAELVLLVKFVRDAREGKNPYATGPEMTNILVRTCKALAVAQQNQRYILDAGALDLLVDALCSGQAELSLLALQALAAVCKEEDDPRLASLDRRGLAKALAYLLGHPPSSEPVLTALTLIANLARATPNRTYFTEHGLLPHLLPILGSLSRQPALRSPSNDPGSSLAPSNACSPDQQQLLCTATSPASPSLAAAGSSHAASPLLPTAPATSPPAASLSPVAMRRATTFRPHASRDAVELQRAANLRQCTLAVAALLQDDCQKDLVLASTNPSSGGGADERSASGGTGAGPGDAIADAACGSGRGAGGGSRSSKDDGGSGSACGLDLILALTQPSEHALVQGAAYECLAVLTTYDPMRQQVKERGLLPMFLQAATSGPAAVQRPAAEAVANVCADPQLVVGTLEEHGGLAALVAMALSPDLEVQRHAARALWHLVAQVDTRTKVVRAGALSALLALSRPTKRGVQARRLARQALRVCHEDLLTRPQVEAAAAAAGVDVEELASFTTGDKTIARISSHPSSQRLSTHMRMPSDLRSAAGSGDTTPSPGGSRWPSFSAPGLCAPALSQGSLRTPASQDEDSGSTPRLQPGHSPRRLSPLASSVAAAATALAGSAAGVSVASRGAEAVQLDSCRRPSGAALEPGGDEGWAGAPGNASQASSPLSEVPTQPSLGLTPTLGKSGLPTEAGVAAMAAAVASAEPDSHHQQQQLAAAHCAPTECCSNGIQAAPKHAPHPDAVDLAASGEEQDSPTPLPIISPIIDPQSSAGSSPRRRWEQAVQQQQQQGAAAHLSSPQRSSSGKVADAVKKLERTASPKRVPEQMQEA